MNILLFVKSKKFSYGGPAHLCQLISNQFLKLSKRKWTISILDENDIKLIKIPDLKKKIQKYDLVCIHGIWSMSGSIIARICRFFFVPYIIVIHGMLDPWSWKKNYFFKKIFYHYFLRKDLEFASGIQFLNNFEKKLVIKYIKNNNHFIFENFISTDNFMIPKKKFFKKNNSLKILFFGRINKKKGLALLIDALKHIEKENFSLTIVGPIGDFEDQKYLNFLEKKISKYNLQKKITIKKPVYKSYEKSKLFLESDVFILPSSQEGDSIAIKECIAHGLPILISKNCKFDVLDGNLSLGESFNNNLNEIVNVLKKFINMDDKHFQLYSQNAFNFSKNFIINKSIVNIYFDFLYKTMDSSNDEYLQ